MSLQREQKWTLVTMTKVVKDCKFSIFIIRMHLYKPPRNCFFFPDQPQTVHSSAQHHVLSSKRLSKDNLQITPCHSSAYRFFYKTFFNHFHVPFHNLAQTVLEEHSSNYSVFLFFSPNQALLARTLFSGDSSNQ